MELENLIKVRHYLDDIRSLEYLKAALDYCGNLESRELLIIVSTRHPSWAVRLPPVFNSRLKTLAEECIEQLHEEISKL